MVYDIIWNWLISNNDDKYRYTIAIVNDIVISLEYSCSHQVFNIVEINNDEFFKDYFMKDDYRLISDDLLGLLQKYKIQK